MEVHGVDLGDKNTIILSLFGAAKSNQKLLVARKATTHYET
jgi:hypothetical protein